MEVFVVTAAALYMACVVSYISAGVLHVRPCPTCPEYVPRSTMPWEGRSPCHLQVGCVGPKMVLIQFVFYGAHADPMHEYTSSCNSIARVGVQAHMAALLCDLKAV